MNPARNAGSSCFVLGYDRTESARAAARWAANELPPNGKLVVVHACRPLHAPSPLFSTGKERHALGRAIVDELLMDGEDTLLDIDLQAEISDDDPVSALINAADRHGARGIIVGCEQHSRLHRALGTVMSDLLKSSPVPVTAVPFRDSTATTRTVT